MRITCSHLKKEMLASYIFCLRPYMTKQIAKREKERYTRKKKARKSMKIYLLKEEVYKNGELQDEYVEVFSSFERAKEFGLERITKELSRSSKEERKSIEQCIEEEILDYTFYITEEDLEYAKQYTKQIEWKEEIEEYLTDEPTHKEYVLDYLGNVQNIILRYLPNQKEVITNNFLYMKPKDLLPEAGTKFQVGDVVTITKPNARMEDLTYFHYPEYSEMYVVRYLPRRKQGQKYLRNTYAVCEIRDEDYAPGIYTKEVHEEQIEKYEGNIEENSPIDVLRKILRKEVDIDQETWNKLKYGVISLRPKDTKKPHYYKTVLKLEKE